MSKRGSDRQITKDDFEVEGEEEVKLTPGSFQRASEDEMRKRKIRRSSFTPSKQSLETTPSAAPAASISSSNPFAKIQLTQPTFSTNAAAAATQPNPFSAKRDAAASSQEPSRSSKRVKFGTTSTDDTPSGLFSSNNNNMSNRALPSAASKAVENAQNLNDSFIDLFLELSKKNPSLDLSSMAIEYGRYARSIIRQYNQERAGIAANGTSISAASAPVAAGDESPQEQAVETSTEGEYDKVFTIDGVLLYDIVNGTIGKAKKDLSFNIEKSSKDGKYIGSFRIGYISVTTFRLSNDLKFTVIDRTSQKKKQNVRTLSFQTRTAEKPDEASTFELRLKDESKYPSLFAELRKCGAVVKEPTS